MMEKSYVDTVRLLLESAPAIFQTPHFAMKGGTAINLFLQKMPRLSVDIDVVYSHHHHSPRTHLRNSGRFSMCPKMQIRKKSKNVSVF